MTDPAPNPPKRSIWHNWISLAGGVVAGGSFFAFILLFAIDQFGYSQKNPYVGILSYLIAPAFLFLGLALVLIGAWQQRRLLTRDPNASWPRLAIDFSRSRDRWILLWFALGTVAFLLCTALGSYSTYQFTESVQFCGQVCHSVMKPEFVAYQRGNHARVACVECHVGSGATSFVKSKLNGSHQVYSLIFNKYHRPIPTPVSNLRPAQDTCERCHWPEKFVGSIDRTYRHYLTDDKSTPFAVRLLLNVGGGDRSARGPAGGIHWHMNVANKIEYYATDPQRQAIPWVRVTGRDGIATVYRTPDFKGEPDPQKIRVMDCIDCHNRPAHRFKSPDEAVDEALYLGHIDSGLPGIKRTAVDLLTQTYSTEAGALAALDAGLKQHYAGQPGLDPSIAAVQDIYRDNFFPEMKSDWSKYPDNVGHLDSPGCFRCHDGNHKDAENPKRIVPNDCSTCHVILAQGRDAELAQLSTAGLTFKHPDPGSIEGFLCSDCHNGKLQGQ
ncbi:MAG TPA: NapC/NirT family cytochrome c [Opitutaceae bacterium]|jgi:nitrate/TMAO reductase-like tetraheme cytochrome c subunit|nr:NapC/NirT family cytochrome c [Opitutaceae bacterium]